MTAEQAKEAYYLSVESMATINKNAASLMKKYECHGATDITGFGILGHARNLVQVQKEAVNYKIHSLPIIGGLEHINNQVMNFRLLDGFSAETSGGLLIMIPASNADAYRRELKERFGQNSWIVGEVIGGER